MYGVETMAERTGGEGGEDDFEVNGGSKNLFSLTANMNVIPKVLLGLARLSHIDRYARSSSVLTRPETIL